jgi:ketosteroid isomerase-like protein
MNVEQLWHRYAAAWSQPERARAGDLNAIAADGVQYTDPEAAIVGKDALSDYMAAFQESVPDGRFKITTVLTHHDRSLASWQLVASDGPVLQTGTSIAVHGSDGRLHEITGFFDPTPREIAQ